MAQFRARARTVDLLGRQQIAGIPTAIHELFKNAHDAYAEHVEVDYYREDRLFVLRDDGVGMTRDEFENRWMVVGTESKLATKEMPPPPVDIDKEPRPVLGEKGIGRLAIGIVGDQLLILTRAVRDGKSYPLVAAFIHWEVFALPGVDLHEIEIPIRELDDGEVVDGAVVDDLVDQFRRCVQRLVDTARVPEHACAEILEDLNVFKFDPTAMEDHLPGPESLCLSTGARGTQFWALPASEDIEADLRSVDKKTASPMEKQLLGFANTITPDAAPPVLSTAFRDHHSDADVREIIGKDQFFTPGELLNADQYICGHVDEYGQFRGDVSVYGDLHAGHVIPFQTKAPSKTACGPFEVYLAYVQGKQRETTLPDEDWVQFTTKAERHGGVYVYMDGIRVLPYGNVDFDWLEIEERRSRSARFYFFSHRRMCGAVLLSRERNDKIREKAGREGFVNNKAYREIRAILENVLVRLAAEFYRDEGHGEEFHAQKEVLRRQYAARERRASQVRPRRTEFAENLDAFFERVEGGDPQEYADRLSTEVEEKFFAALERDDVDSLAEYLTELERTARGDLEELRAEFTVSKPRISLTKSLDRSWRRYQSWNTELEDKTFAPLERKIDAIVEETMEVAVLDAQHFERLAQEVGDAVDAAESRIDEHRRDVLAQLKSLRKGVREGVKSRYRRSESELREVTARVPRMAEEIDDMQKYRDVRARLLRNVEDTEEGVVLDFQRMGAQLEAVSWDAKDDVVEQLTAIEQHGVNLEERLEDALEAAQLGMTVEVISHEFDHNIRDVRAQLRKLKPWAKSNPELGELYRDLRTAFEHLDGYLTLFTPLQRRLYRSSTTFKGGDIESYLRRLFKQRLADGDVSFVSTPSFNDLEVYGYPSTYYPIMVNLVDNALWWLQDRDDPQIVLDFERNAIVVRDNGPGINPNDRELIFGRGFSLKPAGRGLGLTLSRESIRQAGGDLRLGALESGAEFRIELPDDAVVQEEDKDES